MTLLDATASVGPARSSGERLQMSGVCSCPLSRPEPRARGAKLQCVSAGFAGADANHLLQIGDEDLSVADLPRAGGLDDRVDDRLLQVVSDDQATTDITFTVPTADYERAKTLLESKHDTISYQEIQGATDVVKISAIGVGMRSHAGVAARAFRALAEKGINIRAITTSEIKFSVLIDAAYTELAVRTLHSLYGLDK